MSQSTTSRRVYVAGPMTGLPGHNYPAFHAAAARFRGDGHHVENPAENPAPADGRWGSYMRMAIRQLTTCDTIALLPGYEKSRGAMLELRIARELGLQMWRIAVTEREAA